MSSTFGAPSGGMTVGGQPGLLSTRFGSMNPSKGGVGVGSTVLSGNWVAVADCAWARVRKPTAPSAAASAPLADERNNCLRFIGHPLPGGLFVSPFNHTEKAVEFPLTTNMAPSAAFDLDQRA